MEKEKESVSIDFEKLTKFINEATIETYPKILEALEPVPAGAIRKKYIHQLAKVLDLDEYEIQRDIERDRESNKKRNLLASEISVEKLLAEPDLEYRHIIDGLFPEGTIFLLQGRRGEVDPGNRTVV